MVTQKKPECNFSVFFTCKAFNAAVIVAIK